MTKQLFNLDKTQDKFIAAVNADIKELLTTPDSALANPLQHLSTFSGKRLRPRLMLMLYQGLGGRDVSSLLPAAVAFELVHLACLVHDDIMDGASVRNRQPTIHSMYGEAAAILTGDYLFAKAHQLVEKQPALAAILSETLLALCEGQALELSQPKKPDRQYYMKIVQGKTGALVAGVCQAVCEQANKTTLSSRVTRYGQEFGAAFQIIDDVLDIVSSEALLGKPVGSDKKQGIATLPVIIATEDGRTAYTPADVSAAIREAVTHAQNATQQLHGIGKKLAAVSELPLHYIEWALEVLVTPEWKQRLE